MNDFASGLIKKWNAYKAGQEEKPGITEDGLREMLAQSFQEVFSEPHTALSWTVREDFGRMAAVASIPGTKIRMHFIPDDTRGTYRFEVRCIDPNDNLDREWVDSSLDLGAFLAEYYDEKMRYLM